MSHRREYRERSKDQEQSLGPANILVVKENGVINGKTVTIWYPEGRECFKESNNSKYHEDIKEDENWGEKHSIWKVSVGIGLHISMSSLIYKRD